MSIFLKIRHIIMTTLRNCSWHLFSLLPINKRKIVVSCFKGRGYTDNPKYIVEQLLEKNLKIIWLVNSQQQAASLPNGVTPCKYNRIMSIFHFCTASVWIDNVRKDEHFIKRNEQLYIQTWHGGGALKRVEKDVEDKLNPTYVMIAKRDSKAVDIFLSEGKFYSNLYISSFWYTGRILEYGLPRYDIVLKKSKDENLKNKIHDYYNVDRSKKIVLYAPTFRKGYSFEAYNIDYIRIIDALRSKFSEDFVFYVHLHPNVANIKGKIEYDHERIINSTYYPDMQELITASDVLISDYSSAIIDFSLSYKPAFLFSTDISEYENDRNSYYDYRTGYPFPLAENNDELVDRIISFNEEKYTEDLNSFYKKIGLRINPNSSKFYADFIMKFILSRRKDIFFEEHENDFV